MTGAVFLFFLVVGFFLFSAETYAIGGFSIYVILFASTLTTACCCAFLSRQKRQIGAACVLLLNWYLSHYAWTTLDPVITAIILDLITAFYFIIIGKKRFELIIGALFLISVVVGAATFFGLVPNSGDRPFIYIAWSHPDILAIIGHTSNVVLGIASGDSGGGIRKRLESPSGYSILRYSFTTSDNNGEKIHSKQKAESGEVDARRKRP